VHINNDAYRNPSFTNSQAQGTTTHEVGHALGLAHDNNNIYSIMCQTGYGRAVQTVQKVDNDAINILY
jgi:predicted Zn-dependent protease